MAKKFVWDDTALTPECIVVTFPAVKAGEEPVEVKFYELPRTKLIEFVDKSTKLEVEKELDEMIEVKDPVTQAITKEKKTERLPLEQIAREHSDFVFTWLSEMSRGAKKKEWFEKQDFPFNAMLALSDMLLKVNHVEEILASSGNWLMLPLMVDLVNRRDAQASGNLVPISEA